ncbi:phage tail protein [Methylobacterium bullatum]|uniref:Phage minor tail protein n=1 Tax=Methylobacterium bullatum TaxID=570505 RepID=A0A679JXL8_9HYPH|nr:hypothetical protein MBLL_03362 [Methylobacterium bullatum]
MPTLPLPAGVNIALGSGIAEKARLRKAPSGDGYPQRTRDGINHIVGTMPVTFENLTRAEAATLRAFFRERGGDLPFCYAPPDETGSRLWTCEEWGRRYTGDIHLSYTVTFQEQFDPQEVKVNC